MLSRWIVDPPPLVPGAVRIEFYLQLDDGPGALDKDRFTLVAFDPPGYGYSRPPERVFSVESMDEDARIGAKLMKNLGFERYSVIGFCDGARVAWQLAATLPSRTIMIMIIVLFFRD